MFSSLCYYTCSGKPCTEKCPLCQASYVPDHKGKVCKVCKVSVSNISHIDYCLAALKLHISGTTTGLPTRLVVLV